MNSFPQNELSNLSRQVSRLTAENEQLKLALAVAYDAICATMGWIDAFDDIELEYDEDIHLKLANAEREMRPFTNKSRNDNEQ